MKKPCACPSQKKGVVYEVLCKEDCSIWHTLGRQVEPWRRDYRTQVHCKEGRHREWHCSLCEHHPHAMDWKAATVLNEQQRWVRSTESEGNHPHKGQNIKRTAMNLDPGLSLSPIWKPVLTKFPDLLISFLTQLSIWHLSIYVHLYTAGLSYLFLYMHSWCNHMLMNAFIAKTFWFWCYVKCSIKLYGQFTIAVVWTINAPHVRLLVTMYVYIDVMWSHHCAGCISSNEMEGTVW